MLLLLGSLPWRRWLRLSYKLVVHEQRLLLLLLLLLLLRIDRGHRRG